MHTLTEPANPGNSSYTRQSTAQKRPRQQLRVTVAGPEPRHLVITGRQCCRTLLALIDAGPRGTTALEISTWALRMSHYISELRHRWGLSILTESEPHDGGAHGRYVLLDTVTIDPAEAA
jgi:hypothetical protein